MGKQLDLVAKYIGRNIYRAVDLVRDNHRRWFFKYLLKVLTFPFRKSYQFRRYIILNYLLWFYRRDLTLKKMFLVNLPPTEEYYRQPLFRKIVNDRIEGYANFGYSIQNVVAGYSCFWPFLQVLPPVARLRQRLVLWVLIRNTAQPLPRRWWIFRWGLTPRYFDSGRRISWFTENLNLHPRREIHLREIHLREKWFGFQVKKILARRMEKYFISKYRPYHRFGKQAKVSYRMFAQEILFRLWAKIQTVDDQPFPTRLFTRLTPRSIRGVNFRLSRSNLLRRFQSLQEFNSLTLDQLFPDQVQESFSYGYNHYFEDQQDDLEIYDHELPTDDEEDLFKLTTSYDNFRTSRASSFKMVNRFRLSKKWNFRIQRGQPTERQRRRTNSPWRARSFHDEDLPPVVRSTVFYSQDFMVSAGDGPNPATDDPDPWFDDEGENYNQEPKRSRRIYDWFHHWTDHPRFTTQPLVREERYLDYFFWNRWSFPFDPENLRRLLKFSKFKKWKKRFSLFSHIHREIPRSALAIYRRRRRRLYRRYNFYRRMGIFLKSLTSPYSGVTRLRGRLNFSLHSRFKGRARTVQDLSLPDDFQRFGGWYTDLRSRTRYRRIFSLLTITRKYRRRRRRRRQVLVRRVGRSIFFRRLKKSLSPNWGRPRKVNLSTLRGKVQNFRRRLSRRRFARLFKRSIRKWSAFNRRIPLTRRVTRRRGPGWLYRVGSQFQTWRYRLKLRTHRVRFKYLKRRKIRLLRRVESFMINYRERTFEQRVNEYRINQKKFKRFNPRRLNFRAVPLRRVPVKHFSRYNFDDLREWSLFSVDFVWVWVFLLLGFLISARWYFPDSNFNLELTHLYGWSDPLRSPGPHVWYRPYTDQINFRDPLRLRPLPYKLLQYRVNRNFVFTNIGAWEFSASAGRDFASFYLSVLGKNLRDPGRALSTLHKWGLDGLFGIDEMPYDAFHYNRFTAYFGAHEVWEAGHFQMAFNSTIDKKRYPITVRLHRAYLKSVHSQIYQLQRLIYHYAIIGYEQSFGASVRSVTYLESRRYFGETPVGLNFRYNFLSSRPERNLTHPSRAILRQNSSYEIGQHYGNFPYRYSSQTKFRNLFYELPRWEVYLNREWLSQQRPSRYWSRRDNQVQLWSGVEFYRFQFWIYFYRLILIVGGIGLIFTGRAHWLNHCYQRVLPSVYVRPLRRGQLLRTTTSHKFQTQQNWSLNYELYLKERYKPRRSATEEEPLEPEFYQPRVKQSLLVMKPGGRSVGRPRAAAAVRNSISSQVWRSASVFPHYRKIDPDEGCFVLVRPRRSNQTQTQGGHFFETNRQKKKSTSYMYHPVESLIFRTRQRRISAGSTDRERRQTKVSRHLNRLTKLQIFYPSPWILREHQTRYLNRRYRQSLKFSRTFLNPVGSGSVYSLFVDQFHSQFKSNGYNHELIDDDYYEQTNDDHGNSDDGNELTTEEEPVFESFHLGTTSNAGVPEVCLRAADDQSRQSHLLISYQRFRSLPLEYYQFSVVNETYFESDRLSVIYWGPLSVDHPGYCQLGLVSYNYGLLYRELTRGVRQPNRKRRKSIFSPNLTEGVRSIFEPDHPVVDPEFTSEFYRLDQSLSHQVYDYLLTLHLVNLDYQDQLWKLDDQESITIETSLGYNLGYRWSSSRLYFELLLRPVTTLKSQTLLLGSSLGYNPEKELFPEDLLLEGNYQGFDQYLGSFLAEDYDEPDSIFDEYARADEDTEENNSDSAYDLEEDDEFDVDDELDTSDDPDHIPRWVIWCIFHDLNLGHKEEHFQSRLTSPNLSVEWQSFAARLTSRYRPDRRSLIPHLIAEVSRRPTSFYRAEDLVIDELEPPVKNVHHSEIQTMVKIGDYQMSEEEYTYCLLRLWALEQLFLNDFEYGRIVNL